MAHEFSLIPRDYVLLQKLILRCFLLSTQSDKAEETHILSPDPILILNSVFQIVFIFLLRAQFISYEIHMFDVYIVTLLVYL